MGATEEDQRGVDAHYKGRLVDGALQPTCEVERLWVMHLGDVEERFEIAWGDTFPSLWRVSAGRGVSCAVRRRDVVIRLDGGRTFEGGHVAIEENEPEDTRVGSVSRGEDDILN